MPRISCFAALLISLSIAGEGAAQRFVSSEFGTSAAAAIAPDSAASSRTEAASPPVSSSVPRRDRSTLVRPSLQETFNGDVRSVQQAGYTAPADEPPVAQDRFSGALEPDASSQSASDAQSDAVGERDLGFPAMGPPRKSRLGGGESPTSHQGMGSVITVISSLAIVLGLFFITAWIMRRAAPGSLASLPSDVFEVLGRAQLSNRQHVHLLRCGTKLLLVCVSPEGAETLTEIDDPDEATRLAGLCKAAQPGSASAAFRHVLHQFAGQPAESGFIGRSDVRTTLAELPPELENLHG